MYKAIITLLFILIIASSSVYSEDVMITGFPIGVGGSIDQSFFKPYYTQLQNLADTLAVYPLARIVITGGADGYKYKQHNDAKNPSLALGRAHALRMFIMQEFQIDSSQIVIRSEDVNNTGKRYRYVSARLVRDMVELDERIKAIEKRPPGEKHITEVQEVNNYLTENMGLQLGLGITSSSFGAIPVITGGVTWKRMYLVEVFFAHTFWNDTYRFQNIELDTKRRMAGALLMVNPINDSPLGILAGWQRTEEISQTYYKYVQMSEGPFFGLRTELLDYIKITGSWNPSYHRTGIQQTADRKTDQFLISVTANITFGGGQ